MLTPENISTLNLGKQGENKATTIQIDVSEWLKEFPTATINLIVTRPTETTPYIASTTVSNGILSWVITSSDTTYDGIGRAEIRATQSDIIKKSLILTTKIKPSIEGVPSPTPPAPAQSWVNTVIAKANEILDGRVESFEINAQGHLIATLEDGTTQDLGNVKGADVLLLKSLIYTETLPAQLTVFTAPTDLFTRTPKVNEYATVLCEGKNAIEDRSWQLFCQIRSVVDNTTTFSVVFPLETTGKQGQKGDTGAGVPSGGTTGQILKKSSNTDYDTEWANEQDISGKQDKFMSKSQQENLWYIDNNVVIDNNAGEKIDFIGNVCKNGVAIANVLDIENHHDSTKVDKVTGKGLSANDFTNEDKTKVDNAITNAVNNLTNYYLKSETYTKAEVNGLISAIQKVTIQIVESLPQTGESNVIYFVPKTPSQNDSYDEYVWINNTFEHIGSTDVDLSNYYTKSQVDNLIPDISGKENTSNKVTSLSSSSTNTQYPSAKCLYDALSAKGTYSKPANGIPKTDLASDIQNTLTKSDNIFSVGKNKYNKNTTRNGGYWNNSRDTWDSAPTMCGSWYIPVEAGVTYKSNVNGTVYINVYDENKNFIYPRPEGLNNGNLWTIPIDSGISFIRLSFSNSYINTQQLEIGTTSTAYEDYIEVINPNRFGNNTFPITKLFKSFIVVDKNGYGDFTTISAAVNSAISGATIFVMPGEYEEYVACVSKDIQIIGVDKYKCILYNTEGEYSKAPLYIASGRVANMTIKAVRDNNKDYSLKDQSEYAIHIDIGGGENKKILIENCIIHSDFNNTLGCGARSNQTMEISNCHITGVSDGLNLHGGSEGTTMTVILKNNYFNISTQGDLVHEINFAADDTPNTINILALFNVAKRVNINPAATFIIDATSHGNSSSFLNPPQTP